MEKNKLTEFRRMISEVDGQADLRIISDAIRERWRTLDDGDQQKARLVMYVGLKVKVKKHREMGVCEVIKIGPKNVVIKEAEGKEWRVPPTMLTPQEPDAEGIGPEAKQA